MNVPKLRFEEFVGDWGNSTISELSINGFSNGVFNDPKKVGSGYRLINVKDMYVEGSIDPATLFKVDIDSSEFEKNKVLYGDIFFTRSSLVKEGIAYSNVFLKHDEDVTFDGHLIRMRPDSSKSSSKFLYYLFKTDKARNQFIERGKTATMTTIGQADIAQVKINLPEIAEQTKIADFLSAVDEKITALTAQKTALTQYKQGMMQRIFNQTLRFKDDNGADYPEWVIYQLAQFLTPVIRQIPKPDKPYLAIGVRSHFKGLFQKPDSEPEKIDMDVLYQVEENDFVVNITFAWEGALAIANSSDSGGLVSHRFPTYRINPKFALVNFFRYVYPTKQFKSMLELCSPGGAGRNRVLNKSQFLKIETKLPSIDEQSKIAQFLTELDNKINAVDAQIQSAQQWKQGLLQQMFV